LITFDSHCIQSCLMITVEFNKDSKILVNTLTGNINISDVIDMYYRVEYYGSLPADLKIIIDSENARYNFTEKNLQEIMNAIKHLLTKFDSIQEAIVQSSPYETAMAILYEQMVEFDNFRFKAFSTHEAAIQWLQD